MVQDDAQLIAAHLDGDPAAMDALISRYRGPLLGFLRSRVGEEAEDLSQEVWSRAASALPRYTERGTFRAWLFQIARRLLIDHRRRHGARIELVHRADPPEGRPIQATPYSNAAARELSEATEQALCALPAETAAVVRMRLIEDIPFREIARRQGVPLNTALGRMHRGLKLIRRALEADGLLGVRP